MLAIIIISIIVIFIAIVVGGLVWAIREDEKESKK